MDHWKFGLPAELHSTNWREYYVSRHNQDLQVSGLLSVLFSGKQTENRSNKRQAKNTLLRLGVSILDRLNYLSSPSSSNLSIAYYATQITDEINHNICLSWWEDLLSNTSAPLEEGAIIIAKVKTPLSPFTHPSIVGISTTRCIPSSSLTGRNRKQSKI